MNMIQKTVYPALGFLALASSSQAVTTVLEVGGPSFHIDGNEKVAINVKSGSGGDLVWAVNETISVSFDMTANTDHDWITNSTAWAIGIGDGTQAIGFGPRYSTNASYFWNADVDNNGGNPGSFGVPVGSSSDREAVDSTIPQTVFDLRDSGDSAHFTMDITRSSLLQYDISATWQTPTGVHSITKNRTVTAGNEIDSFSHVVFRKNLTSGTADLDVTSLSMIVTEVPEPSSAALLGLGGLALMLRRRK